MLYSYNIYSDFDNIFTPKEVGGVRKSVKLRLAISLQPNKFDIG